MNFFVMGGKKVNSKEKVGKKNEGTKIGLGL